MGDPISQGKGAILGEHSRPLWSNGTPRWAVQKRLDRSTCGFGRRLGLAQWTMFCMGCRSPRFSGLPRPFRSIGSLRCSGCCSVAAAFAASGIIQSRITPCSRRDHSICQASADSILKISGHRRCGPSAAKGVVRLHSAGEVW